jgi:hypothetical protein
MNVPLGTRKLLVAMGIVCQPRFIVRSEPSGTDDRQWRPSVRRSAGLPLARAYFLYREKTKSAVKARLMKYMASTRPTVRNMMVNSRPCASG